MRQKRRLGQRGAVAVEFALLLPILLTFLLGIEEFGRAMWTRSMLQFACEEAVRYAIAHSSADAYTITSYAKTKVIGISGSDGNLTWTVPPPSSTVSVSANYNFTFIAQGLLPYGTITLSASSQSAY